MRTEDFSLLVVTPLAGLLIVSALSGCSSSGGASAITDAGISDASAAPAWSGDPCALLTNEDFGKVTPMFMLASSDSNNVGSTMFSPECHFSLQGDGSSAAVGLFIDKTSDFALQKSIFHGTAVKGLGQDAWQGDAGGQGNSTIDVLLAKYSFRVDATYELEYDDLTVLAERIAARLK